MRFLRLWLPVVVFGLILTVGGLLTWTLTTDSGTRWLIARLSGYLPTSLTLGPVEGNFTDGVRVQSVRWQDAIIDMTAGNAFVHVELRPLLRRQLNVMRIDVDSLALVVPPGGDESGEPALPEFALPLGVRVDSAEVRGIELRRGEQMTVINRVVVGGRMTGSTLSLRRLLVEADDFRIETSGRATFADPHEVALEVDWQWRSPEAMEFAGALALEGDRRRYNLRHTLSSPLAVVTTGNVTGIPLDPVFELRNEWESLTWPVGGYPLQAGAGSLEFTGKPTEYSIVLDTIANWRNIPETAVSLAASGDLQSLAVTRLQMNPAQGRISASGAVRWAPSLVAEADIELSEVDLALAQPWIAYPMPDLPLSASGHVAYGDAGFSFDNARLELGDNRLALDGSFGRDLAAEGDFEFSAIGQVLPDAAGALRGSFQVTGLRPQPNGRVSVSGESLAWRDYAVAKITAEIEAPAAGDGRVRIGFEELTVPGVDLDAGALQVAGTYDAHTGSGRLERGDGELAFVASGAYANGEWRGNINELSVASPLLDRWSSRDSAELAVSPTYAALSELCLFATSGRACLDGSWSRDEASHFSLQLEDLPLAALPVTLPAGAELGGNLHIDASGGIADGQLNGQMALNVVDGSITTDYDGETFTLNFVRAEAAASLAGNRLDATTHLQATDGIAVLSARVGLDDFTDSNAPIRGIASVGVASADIVEVLVPGISDIEGRLTGVMDVSGSLAAPELQGQVAVHGGAFTVRQTGIRVTDINASLSQTRIGQLQLSGSARSGDGIVRIDGNTEFAAETGIRSELNISGEKFQIARLPDWEVETSPQIAVVFDDEITTVSGDLNIPRARINFRSLPETAVRPSSDVTVYREGVEAVPRQLRRINVDVNASLSDDVRFAGFGLTGGIEGAVRIRGGTHDPYTGTGRLDLREGRYKAYGQELEIEQGELLFNGPLTNPEINVRAIRKAGDVTAGIRLAGTPNNLRSEVFSEPPLSDADALSYLLTGRPLATAGTTGEGDTLSNAAFALGLSGAGTVASQVRTSLGLETLSVEGGAEDGRIIAGKRFGDRLLVEYGYGIIDKLGTLLLRYQMTERLVLESRTGTVSNLDIVYRVRSR